MASGSPTVTFVIPCYRLAHFLAECVASVVSQDYANIEILILDDQSPDNTEEVARRIIADHPDRNIQYVRNEKNLGNIRTYNKGISLAAGAHVWILSPDDRLRSRQIVSRYADLMVRRPDVGYVFCPAHLIKNDADTGVCKESVYRAEDQVLDSVQLVKDIADNDFTLLSPSVMIRKECYERVTLFPENLPHRGDSQVWAMIALSYRVGYFAEPMVDYRVHADSMMATFGRQNVARMVEDDIAVPWGIKAAAEAKNNREVVAHCEAALIRVYARVMSSRFNFRGTPYTMPVRDFESSLSKWEPGADSRARLKKAIAVELYCMGLADRLGGHERFRDELQAAFALSPRLRLVPPLGRLMRTARRRLKLS